MKINPATITVSGFSAGSYMSHQLHLIFSRTIQGAGCIAGGPYGVGNIWGITQSTEELVDKAFRELDRNARNGQQLVDDPKNLHGKNVFVAVHS